MPRGRGKMSQTFPWWWLTSWSQIPPPALQGPPSCHMPPPVSSWGQISLLSVFSLFMCSPALCSMDSFHLSSPFYPCFTHFHTYLHTKWFKAKQDNALGVSGGNKSAVAFKANIPRFENFQIFALPSWVVLGGFEFLSFLKKMYLVLVVPVFIAARGFSLVAESGATLHCGAWASHGSGFSCCGAQTLDAWASVVAACWITTCSSWSLECGLSCSATCGIFPDQGLSLCPLHWQILIHCTTREILTISGLLTELLGTGGPIFYDLLGTMSFLW